MTLRYAILALLAEAPASGLDLVRRFEKTAGYAWFAQHSQIYPELARCLAEGLIEQVSSGPRRRRVYRTTERGVEQVRSWLRDTQPDRLVRNEAALRSFFTWMLEPEEAEAFYRSEATYHRGQLEELERIAEGFPADWGTRGPETARRLTLERGLRVARAYVGWAEWSADQIAGLRKKRVREA